MIQEVSILDEEKTSITDIDPNLEGFTLTGWNILIRPVKVNEKTKGGIILADSIVHDAQYLTNIGKVLQVGPQAYNADGFDGTPWAKVGDFVLYPKFTGQKIRWGKATLVILPDSKVIANLSPEHVGKIDPTYEIL